MPPLDAATLRPRASTRSRSVRLVPRAWVVLHRSPLAIASGAVCVRSRLPRLAPCACRWQRNACMLRQVRRPSLHSDGRFYHRWRSLQPSSDAGCAAPSATDGHGTGGRDGGQTAIHRVRPVPDAGRRWSTTRTSRTCARRTPWGPGLMVLHVLQFQQERSVTPMARAAPASSTPSARTGLVCPALPFIPTSLRRVEGAETLSQTHHTTVLPPYPHLPCIDCFLSLVNGVNDE
jgi:hypothetical protein